MKRGISHKLETSLASLVVVGAVVLCLVLIRELNGIMGPLTGTSPQKDKVMQDLNNIMLESKNVQGNSKSSLDKLEHDLSAENLALAAKQQQLKDAEDAARNLIDPGPEPSKWLHFIDHYNWSVKVDLQSKLLSAAKDSIQKIDNEVRELKNQISNQAASIAVATSNFANSATITDDVNKVMNETRPPVSIIPSLLSRLGTFWNAVIIPILHALLLISLVCLIPRLILRLILINGWTKTYRV
jgi:hypothetical protein